MNVLRSGKGFIATVRLSTAYKFLKVKFVVMEHAFRRTLSSAILVSANKDGRNPMRLRRVLTMSMSATK